jgi:hypothetical protein
MKLKDLLDALPHEITVRILLFDENGNHLDTFTNRTREISNMYQRYLNNIVIYYLPLDYVKMDVCIKTN